MRSFIFSVPTAGGGGCQRPIPIDPRCGTTMIGGDVTAFGLRSSGLLLSTTLSSLSPTSHKSFLRRALSLPFRDPLAYASDERLPQHSQSNLGILEALVGVGMARPHSLLSGIGAPRHFLRPQ